MIGWLFFLVILLLVLFIPCGIYARYSSEENAAKLFVGPFRINLIRSRKKKENRPRKKQFESHEKVKNGGNLTDFLPIAKLVFEFLADFKRKLCINDLRLKLVLAGEDPCNLAINYGRYWVALGNLMPHLESWFRIKKRNLEIECDYTANNTMIDVSIDVRVSLVMLLHMVLNHGIRILLKYYKITNKAKDGAVS